MSFGLFAAQPALRLRDLHALAGTEPDQVGLELSHHGEDVEQQPPAEKVRQLVEQVAARMEGADPEALITVLGGGIRVGNYLPTRTFELAVHSLDIGAATGIDVPLSVPVWPTRPHSPLLSR